MPSLLFDLDNTLYPGTLPVVARIDRRINDYLRDRVGIAPVDVDVVRRQFWADHGTTLAGLMMHHRVDPDDYLAYVHDIDLADLLRPDPRLRALITRLPGRRLVFTNASRGHAEKVLDLLGLGGVFEAIVALEDLAYVPKPEPAAYSTVLERFSLDGTRATFIDDSRKNLRAAKAFGMRTVWVSGEGSDGAEGIDHVVPSVHALETIVAQAEPPGPAASRPAPRV